MGMTSFCLKEIFRCILAPYYRSTPDIIALFTVLTPRYNIVQNIVAQQLTISHQEMGVLSLFIALVAPFMDRKSYLSGFR